MSLVSRKSSRRGDTLIEVMFAVGFFALIAIISISVMNSGINNAERDLELVTARNELNAQAEALRFIHSSYISEKTLPKKGDLTQEQLDNGEKYQQYNDLWHEITSTARVVDPATAESSGLLNVAEFGSCDAVYNIPSGGSSSPLQQVNAFILNTRKLTGNNINASYVSIKNSPAFFRPTELSARIIFNNGIGTSDDQLTSGSANGGLNYQLFDRVSAAEGIWDFVVTDGTSTPKYYDFYIQSCWYGPKALRPTVLDTVIRLYNPEGV